MAAVAIHNMPESVVRTSVVRTSVVRTSAVRTSAVCSGSANGGGALEALLQSGGVVLGRDFATDSQQWAVRQQRAVLPLGVPSLDRALPGGGLPHGQVVELALGSSSSLGTSISLAACREAQQLAALRGGEAWCAFVDPSGSLYAPAIVQSMVSLDRLLVVQPPTEALSRVAIKLVEARAFAVIVVDLRREERARSSKEWARAVRRMALAAEHTHAVIVLLTNSATQNRSLIGLPVGMRVHLVRQAMDSVLLSVTKDKSGRVMEPRAVAWQADLPSKEGTPSSTPGLSLSSKKTIVSEHPIAHDALLEKRNGVDRHDGASLRASQRGALLHAGGGWKHPRNMKPKFPVLAAREGRTQLPLFGAQ